MLPREGSADCQGDARLGNYLQAVSQIARIVGLLAAVPFGLPGACWGLLAAAFVGGICSHKMLGARIVLTLPQFVHTCMPSFLITLISTAPALIWAIFGPVDEHNHLCMAAASTSLVSCGWALSDFPTSTLERT
jgi:hypothetical protein